MSKDGTTAIVAVDRTPLKFTANQVEMIRQQFGNGASDEEFGLYLELAKHNRLDPFKKQIYLVGRWDTKRNKTVYTPQTSIEGLRARADETGVYAGSQIFWCGKDGVWVDVWLNDEYPVAAKAEIWKRGSSRAFTHVVKWKDYYPGNKMGFLWKKFPTTMLGKCAEAGALRKGFPDACAGMYTGEEMGQDGRNDEPVTARIIHETTGEVDTKSNQSGNVNGDQDYIKIMFGDAQFPPKKGQYDILPKFPEDVGDAENVQWLKYTPQNDDQTSKSRGLLVGELTAKGYTTSEERRKVYIAFYKACGIRSSKYKNRLSSLDMTAGIITAFIDYAKMLIAKAPGDPIPFIQPKDAPDTAVLSDVDLEEDKEF